MVTVIQTLLQAGESPQAQPCPTNSVINKSYFRAGHKFAANELVNLVLEPGIWWVWRALVSDSKRFELVRTPLKPPLSTIWSAKNSLKLRHSDRGAQTHKDPRSGPKSELGASSRQSAFGLEGDKSSLLQGIGLGSPFSALGSNRIASHSIGWHRNGSIGNVSLVIAGSPWKISATYLCFFGPITIKYSISEGEREVTAKTRALEWQFSETPCRIIHVFICSRSSFGFIFHFSFYFCFFFRCWPIYAWHFCFVCASVGFAGIGRVSRKCLCDSVIAKNSGCIAERDCDAFFSFFPKQHVLHKDRNYYLLAY